jgi:hypothetical protein
MTDNSICRATTAIALVPVLGCIMWLEAIAGTGSAWDELQPGHRSLGWAIGWFVYAGIVPAVVLFAMALTRHDERSGRIVNRALHIEKWGLAFALPLLAVAALVLLGGAII